MSDKETHGHFNESDSNSNRAETAGIDEKYEKQLMYPPLHLNPPTIGVADGNHGSRKVDWRLLPILGALYSVALIDRLNMSNAAVAGMSKDLHLTGTNRYTIALLVFFIPYSIFELPSNLLLRRVGAAKHLSALVVSWGAVMIGMGFINDWKVLVVCRTIMGFFEAGFFPGALYIVSSWYVRYEVQKRLATLFFISIFISAFASILAYGLMHMNGVGRLSGWRWIFIIEGIITVVLGFISYFVIIDFPDKILQRRNGAFLTAQDVDILKARIDRDRDDSAADPVTGKKIVEHLRDFKLWVFALMLMGTATPVYAFAYFTPQILHGMGFSSAMSQLLTAPPSVIAGIIAIGSAVLSDRLRMRGPIIVAQNIATIVGLLVTAYTTNRGLRYFGIILGLSGAVSNASAVLAYQSNNIRMDSKRSVGSALQIGFGAIGGIIASTVFRDQDAPRYVNGIWATIGTQFFMIAAVAGMSLYFKTQNLKQKEDGKIIEGHAAFQYTY